MAEWRFEKKRRSQKSREPMQASFFTSSSIDDDTHALVREAIQNSLDARKGNMDVPVKVRFVLGAISSRQINFYVPASAWLHFNAPENGLINPPRSGDDCKFLVFEDFNTTGLVGSERSSEEEPGNSYYYFMRAEGLSGKNEGDRGRHGIGKYVFPYTSSIRMFIAVTVRESDKRCLIAGQSVLKSHSVNGEQYTPDGWWGEFEECGLDDHFQLPAEDEELFLRIKEDFGLGRGLTDTGLSIVMPFVQQAVTAQKLAEHIVREFFYPILDGGLQVELVDSRQSVQIKQGTLLDGNLDFLPPETVAAISPYIDLAKRRLKLSEESIIELHPNPIPGAPKWTKEYVTPLTAKTIASRLNSNDIVCIRNHLLVQQISDPHPRDACFELLLARDLGDIARKPLFVREGITIPEDRVPVLRGYTSLVVIRKGGLATLLGDSENPAHTEWEKNAIKFKGRYKWGPSTIDFVRLSAQKLLKLLSQSDDEEDRNVLSDIFFLDIAENPEEVPESRRKRKKKSTGPDVPPPPDDIPDAVPRHYRLFQIAGGFILDGPKAPLDKPRYYTVTMAYDVASATKAKALRDYDTKDFNLSKGIGPAVREHANITGLITKANQISFLATQNNFHIEVAGFDVRRDLIIDVKSESYESETV